ncbi:MAG TPA: hypothetical protein VFT90_04495 [Chryseosolibacter sp.]|nr:hypothetical protein [Chryseosolibacter sp.]
MRKYYSVPLLFFSVAALLGLFLRWQFVEPTPGIRFTYFVHGHSHVMFLGWVFNVLYLFSIEDHIDVNRRRRYLQLFVFLQVLVFAMMISFPIQGYGAFSIAFSTAHTLAVMVFIPVFFRHASGSSLASIWFLKAAWIFFFISTLGPFALGYLMASGMGNRVWNNFSIYYYLHFQYNGFFLFGILSLFFRFLEQRKMRINHVRLKKLGWLMAVACVPAYFLSVLFAKPAEFFYWLAATGALAQLIAFILLIIELIGIAVDLKHSIKPILLRVGYLILAAVVLKTLLQLASAHPYVAELAFSMRPVVIAYLHLVLVGIISLFLFAWYMQRGFMNGRIATAAMVSLLIGYFGSEIALVLMPWWSSTPLSDIPPQTLIFALTILMALAGILFLIAFVQKGIEGSESLAKPEMGPSTDRYTGATVS